MEVKIEREFKGHINSVKFYNPHIFDTTRTILDEIVHKFGEVFTDAFISEFSTAVGRHIYKTDRFYLSDFVDELKKNVARADSFEKIVFNSIYFDEVNDEIQRGIYSKEVSKKEMFNLSEEETIHLLTQFIINHPELINDMVKRLKTKS